MDDFKLKKAAPFPWWEEWNRSFNMNDFIIQYYTVSTTPVSHLFYNNYV
ncbi:hypothetical protein BTN50_1069 [Candidatus Enterovibrio altilux]|uniref:Uncharacterized protein n=1 Tax=Candidatus Enterovibrio altilux TaxID=1927128 RepID=A0A291B9B0_9GAMM|nr:hypothetical protein BTN50_1069 [Candidatus Enterovibrio luxaltus]